MAKSQESVDDGRDRGIPTPKSGLSRASSGAVSEISKLSDMIEEHVSKPHRGLLMDGFEVPPAPNEDRSAKRTFHSEAQQAPEPPPPDLDQADPAPQRSNTKKKTLPTAVSFHEEEAQLRATTHEEGRQHQDHQEFLGQKQKRRSSDASVTGSWRRTQSVAQKISKSGYFESFCCALILSNTLFFGVEVQVMSSLENDEPPIAFQIITHTYTMLFAWELLVRLVADGVSFWYQSVVGWNLLDLITVVISVVEFMLEVLAGSGSNLAFVRLIRMARVLRVLRVLRVMRFVRSLRILVHSVLNTLRSLFWTMLLLAMILYLFGILFTQAATQYRTDGGVDGAPRQEVAVKLDVYYGSVPASVFTLFKSISNGVSWQEVVDPLSSVHWVWVALFLVYISFTYLAVLNVVTGVFCQTAIESANHDQDMVIQEQLISKAEYVKTLKRLFRDIDHQNTGAITLVQFEERLQDPNLQAYFSAMEITVDEAWSLFKLLDTDESHIIDIDEFVSGCLRLKGNARTMDIAMLLYQSKWTMQRITALNRAIAELVDGRTSQSLSLPMTPLQSHTAGSKDAAGCSQFGEEYEPKPRSSWRAKGARGLEYQISGL